ncbi:uncharacterized protein LOC103569312 [Microplitis demolitor]|uniref:uncharacterized protein LOC103569312 n=1 Tax=Microplitis demolitor TaxID=69319 RepID=UPI0004CD7EAC|nr:uncharacterized protein LOC103569312 [Microplitis demolitor]
MCIRTCTGDGVENAEEFTSEKVGDSQLVGTFEDSRMEVINTEILPTKPEGIMQCPFQAQRKTFKAKDKFIKKYEDIMQKDQEIFQGDSDVSTDVLGKMVGNFRNVCKIISYYCNINEKSALFKIMFATSQPAHIIMVAVVLYILSIINPSASKTQILNSSHSKLTSFIYLTSFIVHFGAQIWMTFVSGLSLYFALPRHTFNDVQRVLFPRYFTINACLSFITLVIFVKHHPFHTWDTEIATQVSGMSVALILELLIRLYFTPPLLRLIAEKKGIEQAAGVGSETGYQSMGALKDCPHYLMIHRAFRKTHGCIAMGNIITMVCSVIHLCYLSNKFCALI